MNYLSECRNYKYFCLGTVHYTSSVSGGGTTNTQHKKLITFEVKYNPTSKFRLKNSIQKFSCPYVTKSQRPANPPLFLMSSPLFPFSKFRICS